MNNAKNRTPKCAHGVDVLLDKNHSCFECEKEALAMGLPIGLRIVDGANAMLLHAHLQATELAKSNGHTPPGGTPGSYGEKAAEDIFPPHAAPSRGMDPVMRIDGTEWSGDALRRLISDLRKPRDINGDPLPEKTEAGEIKALQRALIEMRRELVEVTADRNAFARENMDLIRRCDGLRGKLRSINVIVNDDTENL